MRRMYSVKELSEIIYGVVGGYIEDGAFDSIVSDAVDAYLVEHPVDITALDGQTIAPAVVNATTSISAPLIAEIMDGYSFRNGTSQYFTYEYIYAGIVKNGNKLTLVVALNITKTGSPSSSSIDIGKFTIPASVLAKLYPTEVGVYNALNYIEVGLTKDGRTFLPTSVRITKDSGLLCNLDYGQFESMDSNTPYYLRFEATYLLSDSLAS